MTRAEIERQADQFLAWHRKRGGELEDDFGAWCRSKDFGPSDRIRIRTAATEQLIATGAAVFTDMPPRRSA